MEYSLIIFVIIFLLVIIEIIIRQTVLVVNKKFQWLIIQKDEIPTLSIELKKFLEHGYDKELGWVRKPNTEHMEVGKYGQTKWTINNKGCMGRDTYIKTSRERSKIYHKKWSKEEQQRLIAL